MSKLGDNVWKFLCSQLLRLGVENLSYVSMKRSGSGHVSFVLKSDGLYLEGGFPTSGSAETSTDHGTGQV